MEIGQPLQQLQISLLPSLLHLLQWPGLGGIYFVEAMRLANVIGKEQEFKF